MRGRRAEKFLLDMAASKRGLREVAKLIAEARKHAGEGRAIDLHHIKEAVKTLRGGWT